MKTFFVKMEAFTIDLVSFFGRVFEEGGNRSYSAGEAVNLYTTSSLSFDICDILAFSGKLQQDVQKQCFFFLF